MERVSITKRIHLLAQRGDVDGLVKLGFTRMEAEELCEKVFNQMAQYANRLMHGYPASI